jgi:hypothetical protein
MKWKEESIMILSAFTLFHVTLSLVAIASGLVVLFGLLGSKISGGWTTLFLATAAATSVTGYFFPFHGFTPSQALGVVSLIVLALAYLALNRFHLAGRWGRTYVITAIIALYLNVFVLIVQLFQKVPALNALAPTQSEPPFQAAQLVTLFVLAVLGIRATVKFHAEPARVAKARSAKA